LCTLESTRSHLCTKSVPVLDDTLKSFFIFA
jgi:hypothetical protein